MSIHASSAGWIGSCPCGWRTVSQTKPVVAQRLAVHEAGCAARRQEQEGPQEPQNRPSERRTAHDGVGVPPAHEIVRMGENVREAK